MNIDYDVLNAVLRGVISALGGGGGITCELIPATTNIVVKGYDDLLSQLIKLCRQLNLQSGDIVTITSSILSMAQGRIVPLGAVPKQAGLRGGVPDLMTDAELEELAAKIASEYEIYCQPRDILLSDTFYADNQTAILLAPEDPNRIAFEFSQLAYNETGCVIDTVIKDSDAGNRRGRLVIGTPTLIATPLGSTKGLSILEAMRIAAASEVLMGKKNLVPLVVSRPANAVVRNRLGMGEQRSTPFLDASREPIISDYNERL
jgi:F420-0:gamma-glutamyl ligase